MVKIKEQSGFVGEGVKFERTRRITGYLVVFAGTIQQRQEAGRKRQGETWTLRITTFG